MYIGITRQEPEKRWQRGYGYVKNIVFSRAIKKYGWDGIKHEILLDGLTEEEAKKAEVKLIAKHKSNDSRYGYNVTAGGDSATSRPHTEEEKERARLNWLGEKNPNARAVICLETLEVFDTAVEAGIVKGAAKVGACCKRGYKHRTSGGYHWAYYNPEQPMTYYAEMLSKLVEDESKPKIVSERARRLTSERCSIAVECVETGEVFSSMREAAQAKGVNTPNICNCCKGNRKTAGGFHWQYAGGEAVNG